MYSQNQYLRAHSWPECNFDIQYKKYKVDIQYKDITQEQPQHKTSGSKFTLVSDLYIKEEIVIKIENNMTEW